MRLSAYLNFIFFLLIFHKLSSLPVMSLTRDCVQRIRDCVDIEHNIVQTINDVVLLIEQRNNVISKFNKSKIFTQDELRGLHANIWSYEQSTVKHDLVGFRKCEYICVDGDEARYCGAEASKNSKRCTNHKKRHNKKSAEDLMQVKLDRAVHEKRLKDVFSMRKRWINDEYSEFIEEYEKLNSDIQKTIELYSSHLAKRNNIIEEIGSTTANILLELSDATLASHLTKLNDALNDSHIVVDMVDRIKAERERIKQMEVRELSLYKINRSCFVLN